MASRLLNSGELKNYHAIGEDGVLVWQRADAFRTSILNSKMLGEQYARCLASPRFTSDGSHVDWFIPFESDRADGEYHVVEWTAASPEEKEIARAKLSNIEEKFINFGYNLQANAINSNDRLFSHFLTGNEHVNVRLPAFHFPDESCVYIVNGEPVITFWGFLRGDGKVTGGPFDSLYARPAKTAAAGAGGVASVAATAATAATATAGVTAARSHHLCCILLPLLLLLLLPLLLYLLWWYFYAGNKPLFKVYPDLNLDPSITVDLPLPDLTLDGFDADLDGVKLNDGIVLPEGKLLPSRTADEEYEAVQNEELNEGEPLAENTDLSEQSDVAENDPSAQIPEIEQADDTDNTTQTENEELAKIPLSEPDVPLDDSMNTDDGIVQSDSGSATDAYSEGPAISNSDLKSGDISKFDGTWKVKSMIVDKQTNKPLQLQYDFKNGKGTATITQQNGVKCQGAVDGGLSNNSFTIGSGATAKCTDGSTYALPSVECVPGKNGYSQCTSTYSGQGDDGKNYKFPMTIHR
ncbi:MAG: hypothetical protein ACI4UM_08035 [Succinivibrio sp.]